MIPTEPGIYPGLSRKDYERIDAVNFSTLREMLRSPASYRASLTRKRKPTDTMVVGSATHVLVLEPEKFSSRFAIWDGDSRRGKDWDSFRRHCESKGLEVLTEKMDEGCRAIADAVIRDELCAPFLRGGQAEVSLVWWYEAPSAPTGEPGYRILCKGRPDLASDYLVDLKTTKDASPFEFGKYVSRMAYTSQVAFYRYGLRAITGMTYPSVILAVENFEPYIAQPYLLTEAQLQRGEDVFRTCLDRIHECRTTNNWPGYADRAVELQLPKWDSPDEDDIEDDISDLGLELTTEEEET